MDAKAITNFRTAGGHAVVAANYLAKGKILKSWPLLGVGRSSSWAGGFSDRFPIELVQCYDNKAEHMFAFREEMVKQFPLQVQATASPQEAVDGADIVLMVISAHELALF